MPSVRRIIRADPPPPKRPAKCDFADILEELGLPSKWCTELSVSYSIDTFKRVGVVYRVPREVVLAAGGYDRMIESFGLPPRDIGDIRVSDDGRYVTIAAMYLMVLENNNRG